MKNKIIKLIENLNCDIHSQFNDNIEIEEFGSQATCPDLDDMIEDFIVDVAKELKINELIEMFKKPLSIDEIVKKIDINNVYDFEELEDIDSIEDCNLEDKYIYRKIIFKHMPTNLNYSFTLQITSDRQEYLNIKYDGQVEKKEVIQTKWIVK